MRRIDVGIGEMAVSKDPNDIIKTYALGSCVGVMMYDRVEKIAGLIHVALPDSNLRSNRGKEKTAYFADQGIDALIREIKKQGATRKNTWIKIAGGANIMDENERFNIGKRNVLAVKKHLWKNRLGIIKEDTGGLGSRTVTFYVLSGQIIINSGNEKWEI